MRSILGVVICLGAVHGARADVPPVPPLELSAESSLASLVERVALFEAVALPDTVDTTGLKPALHAQKEAARVLLEAVAAHGERYPDPANRQAQYFLQGEITRAFVQHIRTWNPPPPPGWPRDGDELIEYRAMIDEIKMELVEPYAQKLVEMYERVLVDARESGVESEWVAKARERLAAQPKLAAPAEPASAEPALAE